MFLDSIKRKKAGLSSEEMAELLKTTPEALNSFEKSYQDLLESDDHPDELFEVNSRQASRDYKKELKDGEGLEGLCGRIVEELVADTSVYVYDREMGGQYLALVPNSPSHPVSRDEIKSVPEDQRPQLSGNYYQRDTALEAAPLILYHYQKFLEEKNPEKKEIHYNIFRQGLDIQDLDPILYEILGTNRNSIGHWLPKLVDACRNLDFFKIPSTRVAKVPLPILQLTRLEYAGLTASSKKIVNEWAKRVFSLNQNAENGYFIKTGTYSSKFDFRNAKVTDPKEINEIGEYLIFIQYQANMMAGPLSSPSIYGVSTTNEWAVREFIPDREGNPCIYKGLPLRTEYRVFIDCDTDEVIGVSPYWEPEIMKRRFSKGEDKDSPHQVHDYLVYLAHEETLMGRYHANVGKVVNEVEKLLPWLDLVGQWSLDVMQDGDDFWLIDMAVAERSALYKESVPEEKRRPSAEDWLPKLQDGGEKR